MRPVSGHDGSVGAVAVKHQPSDFHAVLIGVTCGDHAPGLLPQAGGQTVPGQGELAAVHGAAVPEDVGAGGGEDAEVHAAPGLVPPHLLRRQNVPVGGQVPARAERFSELPMESVAALKYSQRREVLMGEGNKQPPLC